MTLTEDQVTRAWQIRQQFPPRIWFSAPGAKHYQNQYYENHVNSFVNVSVTGSACACRCEHCDARLLQTMIAVPTPGMFRQVTEQLVNMGCQGVLVSGGANQKGEVPLLPFMDAIADASRQGLQILVHSGLVNRETAIQLKDAGVQQVLMDIIGDTETIQRVYHLDRRPRDYLQSMLYCREAGLNIAPHIVIGLNYGQIRGERHALQMIKQADPETIVLVVLTPAHGTAMATVSPPNISEVGEIIAEAREALPRTPIALGCARPAGNYKRILELEAVVCGVNGIAYPDEATIVHAQNMGLEAVFSEACCSLIGRQVRAAMGKG
ncbi:MAG: radical SAM protein [Syntrophomonadaceae bacterium]